MVVNKTAQKILFVILALVLIMGLGWHLYAHQIAHPASQTKSVVTSSPESQIPAIEPQIDNQNGVLVLATYLPQESSLGVASIDVEIKSDSVDLSAYDYAKNIILADSEIAPLTTLSSENKSQTSSRLEVRMKFNRARLSHHHLLVNNLGGIRNRVLHFYL